MKKLISLFIMLSLVMFTTGCMSSNAGRGAFAGAGLGALGSHIGKGDGRTTALYAAGGAILGYALGNEIDKKEAQNATYQNSQNLNQHAQSTAHYDDRDRDHYDGRSQIFINNHHDRHYYDRHDRRYDRRHGPVYVTECRNVFVRVWIRGVLVDTVEERCEQVRIR